MIKNTQQNIGVIGGGLGGLAAACTLAARGYKVTLFEANEWVGGKAAVLHQDGYRFDMGPTILTIPSVLKRIFAEANRNIEDYLDLIRLDPQWRCFYEDGTTLDLHEDRQAMAEILKSYSPDTNSAEGYQRFMRWSDTLSDLSDRYFFNRNVGGIVDSVGVSGFANPAKLADIVRMGLGKTVGGSIRSYIPDKRVAQMLDHFTQYVGSSPDASPAVLCGIASMQTGEGLWYPIGGTRAVPIALEQLARELGVEIHTSTKVTQVHLEAGRVCAVSTENNDHFPVNAVVSNMDSIRVHRELINDQRATRFLQKHKAEPACSGVVMYLGLKERYEHVLHHNFVFSKDPHQEFTEIYQQGKPAEDPTAYVCCPSLTEAEGAVAPEGGEALYILVHTPYLRDHHDWKKMYPEYRQVILDKLKRVAGMSDIETRIDTEAYLTPQDIHERYRVLNGAIYGLASHGRFKGAFKPANRQSDIPGLYLAGGAAHPGPGMPMVMMSGWIAADTLDQDGIVTGKSTISAVTIETSTQQASTACHDQSCGCHADSNAQPNVKNESVTAS